MSIRALRVVGLLPLGLLFACSGNSNPDMAQADMRAIDQASPADMSTPPDLSADMKPSNVFNGCDTANFTDATATGASRTVTFGGTVGNAYMPKCLLIAASQMVTFSGTFSTHPLHAGTTSDGSAGSSNNPITSTSTGTSANFTFPTAGTYPYYCTVHGSSGMAGVIRVQ